MLSCTNGIQHSPLITFHAPRVSPRKLEDIPNPEWFLTFNPISNLLPNWPQPPPTHHLPELNPPSKPSHGFPLPPASSRVLAWLLPALEGRGQEGRPVVEGGSGTCSRRNLLWTPALSSASRAPRTLGRLRKNGGGEKCQYTRVGERVGTGSVGASQHGPS